ncbi:hypothetical protein Srufu_068680 [Streptomyces libani subsp. rufus]|nr:hypothetical protein Srufu_068680 [Streptomyces libani subsp. rufus]
MQQQGPRRSPESGAARTHSTAGSPSLSDTGLGRLPTWVKILASLQADTNPRGRIDWSMISWVSTSRRAHYQAATHDTSVSAALMRH